MALHCSCVSRFIDVRFGTYWRISPLVFSLVPRSQGTVWIREVDHYTGGTLDLFVSVKLRTVVDGDGLEETRMRLDQLDHASVERDNFSAGKLSDQSGSRHPLHQRHDAVLGSTLNCNTDVK
jgi:hypothetical protein